MQSFVLRDKIIINGISEGLAVYIYSKWSEKDLLHLSAVNGVADLYELLGIYISYCGDPSQDSFQDYYRNTVGKLPYHFRNIGELKVKNDLARNGIKVPRRDFRCFARTRKTFLLSQAVTWEQFSQSWRLNYNASQ